jgi:hypothetical protein
MLDPTFTPGAIFGVVDGVPVAYEPARGVATAFAPGAEPARFPVMRFREDAEFIDEAAFNRAIAASHAGT